MFGDQSKKDDKSSNNKEGGSKGLFGSTSQGAGSLFGGNSTPTGGMFNASSGGSLFSNNQNSTLKTSERKQGGLFGNLSSTKKQSDNAPTLNFSGMNNNQSKSTMFGGTPAMTSNENKEEKKSQPSSGQFGLFNQSQSQSTTPTGGLFGGQTTQSNNNTNANNQGNKGLFGNSNNAANKPSTNNFGLFNSTPSGNSTSTPTVGGLFGNSNSNQGNSANQSNSPNTTSQQKKPQQKANEQAQSSFRDSGLFAKSGNTSKGDANKGAQGVSSIFGSSSGTSNGPLFGNLSKSSTSGNNANNDGSKNGQGNIQSQGQQQQQQQSQTPKFSLANNVQKSASFSQINGGQNKQQQQQKPKSQFGLFNNPNSSATPQPNNNKMAEKSLQASVINRGSVGSLFGSNNNNSNNNPTAQGNNSNSNNNKNPSPSLANTNGLFNNNSNTIANQKESSSSLSNQNVNTDSKNSQNKSFSLFGNTNSQETPRLNNDSSKDTPKLGAGLFSNNNNNSNSNTSNKGGLFDTNTNKAPLGNQKKQDSSLIKNDDQSQNQSTSNKSPSLFDLKPKAVSPGGLFANNAQNNNSKADSLSPNKDKGLAESQTLQGSTATGTQKNKQQPASLFKRPDPKQLEQNKNSAEVPSNLLATFSNNETSTIPQNLGAASTSKLVSFNDNNTKEKEKISSDPSSLPNVARTTSQGLMESKAKPQGEAPSTGRDPLRQTSMGRSRMTKESFFDNQYKEKKSDIILTSFEISKIMQSIANKKSRSDSSTNRLQREMSKQIEEWISISFARHNKPIDSTNLQKQKLHENDDVNRFLNDISGELIQLLNLAPTAKSIRFVNQLFEEMTIKLGVKQYLFNDETLNNAYFLKHQIYRFGQKVELNLESQELGLYLNSAVKKYVTNQFEYLEYVENNMDLLKQPSQLFYHLLSYCLKYKKYRLSNQINTQTIDAIEDFQRKVISKIGKLLDKYLSDQGVHLQLIKKDNLNELIVLLEDFAYGDEEIIDISLKVILSTLDLGSNKPQNKIHTQTIKIFKQTKSLQLLPFRTILSSIGGKKSLALPSSEDLYKFVKGPEWIDWLEIYLNSDKEKQLQSSQAKYVIRILKHRNSQNLDRQNRTQKDAKYIQSIQSKVLTKKKPIYKFILALKQENMLDIFYEVLTSLVYDYESYRRVEEVFFKQKGEFNYEFKNIIAEIANYPTLDFAEEVPFMEEKLLYFLRIIEIAPEKSHQLEKNLFDGPLIKGYSRKLDDEIQNQTGHKICHYVIDAINYYSIKSSQKVIAKCFSCITSLLSNQSTHMAMKVAMCINKPQMSFLSNKTNLSLSVSQATNKLLQYLLHNQSFINSTSINIEDHSQEMGKMYPFRYSYNQYLSYIDSLLSKQEITITFPSYWIYKALEGLTSQKNPSIYIINLIIEKLYIIPAGLNVTSQQRLASNDSLRNYGAVYSRFQNNIPKVLAYLVEALNSLNLNDLISQHLEYKVVRRQVKYNKRFNRQQSEYGLVNSKLEDNSSEKFQDVFLALRAFKLLLNLYRILESFRDSCIQHFMVKLLGKIKYFYEIERIFLTPYSSLSQSENSTKMNQRQNIVISLLTFVLIKSPNDDYHSYPTLNIKAKFEKQWVVAQKKSNFQTVETFYRKNCKIINYESLNNFLAFSDSQFGQNNESFQSVAVDCLNSLIQKSNSEGHAISLMKYIGFNNLECEKDRKIIANNWVIEQFQHEASNILIKSDYVKLKESLLRFIVKCRGSRQNQKIGSKIFFAYFVKSGEPEKIVRLNSLICNILAYELESNSLTFNQNISEKYLNQYLKFILNQLAPKDPTRLITSFTNKKYQQMSYYCLQRLIEERSIIELAHTYETLFQIISILQNKFFVNQSKYDSIKVLTKLIAKAKLLYLSSNFQVKIPVNKMMINYPRKMFRDPLEAYISNSDSAHYIHESFQIYKKNITSYLIYYAGKLNGTLNKFIKFLLTVNDGLYGNQTVQIKTKSFSEIFCHMHMGNFQHNAIELFGQSQTQAIETVKDIYDHSFNKLEVGMDNDQLQTFSIMTYCLGWLNSRGQASNNAKQLQVSSTMKSQFWLSEKSIQFKEVAKFLLSLVTIGHQFMNRKALKSVKKSVIKCINNYRMQHKKMDETLFQQILNIMTLVSFQVQQMDIFSDILQVWTNQSNNQYFYNESRLVLQLCMKYPKQIAKYRPLQHCKKITNIIDSHPTYAYKLRQTDSLSWTWGLKIASALMSDQQESIIVHEEVSHFFITHKQKFINIFATHNTQNITLGYLDELEASLQLFYTLVNNKTWIAVNSKLFEELTYIFSHKLVNFFADYINGKIKFVAQSDMEYRFNKIFFEKYPGLEKSNSLNTQADSFGRQFNSEKDSVFKLLMECKMMNCIKLFVVGFSNSLQSSCFVQKYFAQEVWQNYRYGVSYWDRLNKNIVDMLRFNATLLKRWKKCEHLNEKLSLLTDCMNSAEFYVETGYLNCLSETPKNSSQMFKDIYELSLYTFELSTIHLLLEQNFRNKFNSLMKSHLDSFAKKIIQSARQFNTQYQSQTIIAQKWDFINKKTYDDIVENIETLVNF